MKVTVGTVRIEVDVVGILALVTAIVAVARYRDVVRDLVRSLTGQPPLEPAAEKPPLTLQKT